MTTINKAEKQDTETYEQHANRLLSEMGVKFQSSYITYGKHFADDKEPRHIFKATFSRGSKSFSIRFGQSIQAGAEPPCAYDVCACLQKYDCGSFTDFCYEFGYDTDSRTAERTYKAVCKEYNKVSNFFTLEELEILQEIQ